METFKLGLKIGDIPCIIVAEYEVELDVNRKLDIRVHSTKVGNDVIILPRECLQPFADNIAKALCERPWIQYADPQEPPHA